MNFLQWIGAGIIVILLFWIFSRLFWKSAIKGYFEELEKYKNKETINEERSKKENGNTDSRRL